MVNKHLPYPVKMVRAFEPTIELINIIVNKEKKKIKHRSACYVIADAIDMYWDSVMCKKKEEK